MKRLNGLAIYGLVQLIAILLAGEVFSQADFYKGKTIKIIRGGGPGDLVSFKREPLCGFWKSTFPENPI